jgi:hypothetical protein
MIRGFEFVPGSNAIVTTFAERNFPLFQLLALFSQPSLGSEYFGLIKDFRVGIYRYYTC